MKDLFAIFGAISLVVDMALLSTILYLNWEQKRFEDEDRE